MRGAFGVMAAAAATVVVAAWRRVQREGVEARIARRARERARAAEPVSPYPAPIEPAAVPAGAAQFEPVEIRVVSRTRSTPAEPVHVRPLRAVAPAPPAAGPGAIARPELPLRINEEPARTESRAHGAGEPARSKPPRPIDEEPAHAGPTRAPGPRSGDAAPPVASPKGGAARPDRAARPPAWPGGSRPGPAHVPRPMYWPAVLALGTVWAAWGSISSPLLIYGGLAVFAVGLAFWIREMTRAH